MDFANGTKIQNNFDMVLFIQDPFIMMTEFGEGCRSNESTRTNPLPIFFARIPPRSQVLGIALSLMWVPSGGVAAEGIMASQLLINTVEISVKLISLSNDLITSPPNNHYMSIG